MADIIDVLEIEEVTIGFLDSTGGDVNDFVWQFTNGADLNFAVGDEFQFAPDTQTILTGVIGKIKQDFSYNADQRKMVRHLYLTIDDTEVQNLPQPK